MKKTFRIAAVILAACMLLCALPLAVHATKSLSNFERSGNIISWDYEESGVAASFEFEGLWQNSMPILKREFLSQYQEYFDITWTETWDSLHDKKVGTVSLNFQEMMEYFSARSSDPLGPETYIITIKQDSSFNPVATTAFPFKYVPRPEGVHGVRVEEGTATPSLGKPGTFVGLRANSKPGYTFDHWEIVEGNAIIDEPDKSTTVLTIATTDVKVKAIYKLTGTPHSVTVEGYGAYGTRDEVFKGENVVIGVLEQYWDDFLGWEVVSGGVSIVYPTDTIVNFKMPDNDVVIRANFTVYHPDNPFVDVKEDDYFFDSVMWAIGHYPVITKGTDETHFSPNASCTRAQAVTFLWRAAGQPEPKSADDPFDDVKAEDYFYKAVLWAVEEGITKGTGPTAFSPNSTCTRGQIVTFLYRAQGSPAPGTTENPFGDVTEADYYYSAVLWAVGSDITKGTSATAFSPNSTCTRGQIVTFLYRAMK